MKAMIIPSGKGTRVRPLTNEVLPAALGAVGGMRKSQDFSEFFDETTIELRGDTIAANIGRPISIMMIGLRGFPGVQGGVETHAEHLCPPLAEMGCDVTVLARSPYQPDDIGPEWKGVKFVSLWTHKLKSISRSVPAGSIFLPGVCRHASC